MKRKLRLLMKILVGAICVSLLVVGAYLSAQKSRQISSAAEIINKGNISDDISSQQHDSVRASRYSAVRVMSYSAEYGGIASSSGTYVTYDYERFYVITAYHGMVGPCEYVKIVVDDAMYACLDYVNGDEDVDFMIMEVEEIPTLDAIHLPSRLPANDEWRQQLSVMKEVYYTGYPSGEGPVTLSGNIMSYEADNRMIAIDSFAWPGSSGAGVFSEDGKLIGIVIALEVGNSHIGYHILENFVWVLPVFRVEWESILIGTGE